MKKSENLDLQPVYALLQRHAVHDDAYAVNFRGLPLTMQPDVFNPTYTKVSGFLADTMHIPYGARVLDMFTGSGAIGLLAAERASSVVGVDISQGAIQCARQNAANLQLGGKVEFRRGNLWSAIGEGEKFDVITANPPLLPVEPETTLEQAVADSPEMSITQAFMKGVQHHLEPSGVAYMAFSNACSIYVGDPVDFVYERAEKDGLIANVHAEWDVGYEIYRIMALRIK